MNNQSLRVLKEMNEIMDDSVLYGRPPRGVDLRGEPMPSLAAAMRYRRANPSARCRRAIERLLSERRQIAADADITCDPTAPSWTPAHAEVALRSRCFVILNCSDCEWCDDQKRKKLSLPGDIEGWLLMEDGRPVGAAEFGKDADGAWIWRWAFIDPEHRRQGHITRRLPFWEARYGGWLIIDQPNEAACAMLRAAGYANRVSIIGPPIHQDAKTTTACELGLHDYERILARDYGLPNPMEMEMLGIAHCRQSQWKIRRGAASIPTP